MRVTDPCRYALLLGLALSAAACASVEPSPPRPATPAEIAVGPRPGPEVRSNRPIPNPPSKPIRSARRAEPEASTPASRALGRRTVGKPYQVAGVWYTPAEQPDYDAVGTASWYGDAFHGRPTASGEPFDMHAVSAAHPTLPLQSIVEVTDLDSERSLKVRINDRGPFKPGRIIDLSREAADQLGFRSKGMARVRVRYVGPAEDEGFGPRLWAALGRKSEPEPVRVASTSAPARRAAPEARRADPTPSTGFVIQAGAFANPDNARRAAESLSFAGRADIREMERAGGRLYRVVVGDWAAKADAEAALLAVASAGFADARVISAF